MAERQGFEPWGGRPPLVFKTSALSRSATSPAGVIVRRSAPLGNRPLRGEAWEVRGKAWEGLRGVRQM